MASKNVATTCHRCQLRELNLKSRWAERSIGMTFDVLLAAQVAILPELAMYGGNRKRRCSSRARAVATIAIISLELEKKSGRRLCNNRRQQWQRARDIKYRFAGDPEIAVFICPLNDSASSRITSALILARMRATRSSTK